MTDAYEVTLRDMPLEKITAIDNWFLVNNPTWDVLKLGFVVVLACGHKHITKAKHQARCPRCCEMLRRSCKDGSEDYDAFRNHGTCDKMEWPDDPLRLFHEPFYAQAAELDVVRKAKEGGTIDHEEAAKRFIEIEKKYST